MPIAAASPPLLACSANPKLPHSPPIIFFSPAAPCFLDPRSRSRTARTPRSSPDDAPPPSPLVLEYERGPEPSGDGKVVVAPEIDAPDGIFAGVGDFVSVEWMMRLGLRSKSSRGRPLWRRIFLASKKFRSIILLNVLAVIYASDIPVLKEVEAITEPAFFNMVRFCVSAIPFLPFVLKSCGDRHTRDSGVELGLWISFAYLAQALGLLTSEAGRASFISAFTVIVVPLIAGIFGASVPALTWFGAIVSLVGVAMLECGGSPPCVGDILNILSAIFFGIHMLRTEQISRNTEKEKFLAILSFEVCVVALSSVMWFVMQNMLQDVHPSSFDTCSMSVLWEEFISFPWIPALYTGLFSTVLCLWVEMYAMGDVSATETAVIYGLEPVWGAAFAWFLLKERWDMTAWIGAALVLCGSLTVQIFGSAPEKSKKSKENGSLLKTFSFSTVVVESRKNFNNQINKQKNKF